MRILLAEDERPLSKVIIRILARSNFSIDTVYDGAEALVYLKTGEYDAALLDVMMPKMDGFEVLRAAREDGIHTPVVFLSARSDVADRVAGLDAGASYYLTKPFDSKELVAVLRAVTRPHEVEINQLSFGNLTLDRTTFELMSPTNRMRLASKEFQLMELFLSHPRCIFSTERIMDRIWGADSETEVGVVAVYMSYLRKKLAALDSSVEIHALRGAGYFMEEREGAEAEEE